MFLFMCLFSKFFSYTKLNIVFVFCCFGVLCVHLIIFFSRKIFLSLVWFFCTPNNILNKTENWIQFYHLTTTTKATIFFLLKTKNFCFFLVLYLNKHFISINMTETSSKWSKKRMQINFFNCFSFVSYINHIKWLQHSLLSVAFKCSA